LPRHHVERLSRHAPDRLFALAADVRAYPEFVPWILAMRVWDEREVSPTVREFKAESTIGFSVFRGAFASPVRLDLEALEVRAGLLSGPFRRLTSRWRFDPEGEGARILFDIDFEFQSRLLQMLLDANFDLAVGKLIARFEARADEVYGALETSGT